MSFVNYLNLYLQFCFFFEIELMMGEAELLYFFPKKNKFLIKSILGILLNIVFSFSLFCGMYYFIPNFASSLLGVSSFYIAIWLFTYLPIQFCFSLDWKESLFIIIAGYSFQHGVYSLLEPFKSFFKLTTLQSGVIFDIATYIPFFFLYFFFYSKKVNQNCEIKKHKPNFLFFSFFLVISADVFNVFVQFHEDFNNASDLVKMVCHFYSFLVSLASLFLLYSFTRMNRLEQDTHDVELLLENEKKRMIQENNNIEVINRKVHDLKHMMNIFSSSLSDEERDKEILDINQVLLNFEENIHTGNKALDNVLITRKRLCDKENISLSLITDGNALCFMDYVDILSLFSNLLDNAIDGVKRLNIDNKKHISLKVEKNLNQVFIHIENDCLDDIKFDGDNLPITSSNDKIQHGYGVKSIRYLTQKYHGNLNIYVSEHKFIVDILIPTE